MNFAVCLQSNFGSTEYRGLFDTQRAAEHFVETRLLRVYPPDKFRWIRDKKRRKWTGVRPGNSIPLTQCTITICHLPVYSMDNMSPEINF